MRLTIRNFTGELEDYHADVQYRWRRNFALGVGYDYTQREVDVRNQDPSGVVQGCASTDRSCSCARRIEPHDFWLPAMPAGARR